MVVMPILMGILIPKEAFWYSMIYMFITKNNRYLTVSQHLLPQLNLQAYI